MTRQRLWQIKQKAKGRCQKCGQPRANASYCDRCRLNVNAALRERRRRKSLQ